MRFSWILSIVFLCLWSVSSSCLDQDLFSFDSTQTTFEAAQANCVGSGGSLARVENVAEFDHVASLTNGAFAWIGVDARAAAATGGNGNSESFVFTDGVLGGEEFFRVANGQFPWNANEPTALATDSTEHCVLFFSTLRWIDIPCTESHGFVCRVKNSVSCLTSAPSKSPTPNPTLIPTKAPTTSPSKNPTKSPSKKPTESPSKIPTESPSKNPTKSPSAAPTFSPTKSPEPIVPSISPTFNPVGSPVTENPTSSPSQSPLVSAAECVAKKLGINSAFRT